MARALTFSSGPGIFSSTYRFTTIGLLTAIVACAFDQTAVTAVMPHIASELGNSDAYSLTFVSALAASLLGMAGSGLATDRFGARISFIVSAIILSFGLLLSVVAPNIWVFLVSRAIQGLGTGGLIVAVYAVIALVYPISLRQSVFAAFAGAWVLPSLIGPGLAGFLTVTFSWHSVFLLAMCAVIISVALLSKALLVLQQPERENHQSRGSMLFAALVLACAATGMSVASQLSGVWSPIVLIVSLIIACASLYFLTPRGTLRFQRGVPRLVATRGFVDMFFAAEVYLPLLLAQAYGLGPSLTGIALTISGVFWFLGSQYQSRWGARYSTPYVFRFGVICMALGTLWVGLVAFAGGHWILAVSGWGLATIGMGFLYPRMSSKPLELCKVQETGFTGSALQIVGTTGTTIMLAFCSLIQVFGDVKFLPSVFVLVAAAALPLLVMWRRAVPEPRE